MDRILITIVLLTTLIFWLIRNKDNLTYSKLAEILIAFYIFSCAFPRLFLPLYTLNYPFHWGTFDIAFRIQIYLLLIPFFLLIISKRFNWKVQPIKKKYILIILLFIGYTMLNPYDTVKDATLIPVVYLLAYLVFLYLLYSTCTIKTIIKGIYLGFAITIALHFVLAILFPVMNISSAITLFSYDATIRAISRAGAVGTFSHPNSLGVYASYYLMFFLSCVLIKFRTKDSILLSICAFIIIVLTGSRSALISGVVGLMAMICLYIYRQYQIFSPKIFFKGVIPVVIIATILLFFTPISKLFFNSDMDEMALARIMHYICGFEIFKEHPLIGVGLNSHLKYLNDNIDIDFQLLFSTDEWLGKDFMYSDPIHNMWIVILTEMGLIGLLAIAFYIGRFIFLFKKRIAASNSIFYNISLITTLGIICCLLVQGNSDWAPLTPTSLNISLLFFFISAQSNDSKINDYNTSDNISCCHNKL